jgi:hypothetical protein
MPVLIKNHIGWAPRNKYGLCTGLYMIYEVPQTYYLCSSLSQMIPYHTSRVYIEIVHGPPTDVHRGVAWKACTRVR